MLVLTVGDAGSSAERLPLKLNQLLRINAVVGDPFDNTDEGLFPGVPQTEMQRMYGVPTLEAYQIR
jgi:hypothetical protein